MKIIKKFFLISIFLFFSSCSDYGQEEKNKLTDIEGRLGNVQYEIDKLESAISDLRNETDDFSDENWQDNVSDIEEATSSIEYIFNDLKDEVNGLDNDYSSYKEEQFKIIEEINY